MKNSKVIKGKSSLRELASSLPDYFADPVQTGVYLIDKLLNGGIDLGTFVQLVAEPGIGKSTIALQVANNLCSQGYNVLYVDSEHSVSRETLTSIGLFNYKDNFFLVKESEFASVEQKLDEFILTGEINFVVIDSMACLINSCFTNIGSKKGSISVTTNNSNYMSGPVTKFMNKYKSLAAKYNIGFIIINQNRNSVNMTTGTVLKMYGAKNVEYNTDTIIRIKPIKATTLKDFKELTKDVVGGNALSFEIIKSNKAEPDVVCPGYLMYGKGVSNLWTYIYQLKKNGIIEQKGTFYTLDYHGDSIKGQGILNFMRSLEDNDISEENLKELLYSIDETTDCMEVVINNDDSDDEFEFEYEISEAE